MHQDSKITYNLTQLYNSGNSYEQIARLVGKSQKWVMMQLRGHITPRPPKRKKVEHAKIAWATTGERDSLIAILYKNNIGAYIISRKLGIGKRTVFRVLARLGIATDHTRRSGKLTSSDRQRIRTRYLKGERAAALATEFGVSEQTILYDIAARHPGDSMSAIPIAQQSEVIRLATDEKWSSYRIADYLSLSHQNIQNFLRRKKLSPGWLTPEWKEAMLCGLRSSHSRPEKQLANLMDRHGITYQPQYKLDDFLFDFALADGQILLEHQGPFWHTKPQRRQRDLFKQVIARRHGRKLVIVWQHELPNEPLVLTRIEHALQRPIFDFRNCIVQAASWSSARTFLDIWHYQKAGRCGLAISASHNERIIAIAVFAPPMRQETASYQGLQYSEILEITRLVIHPAFQAANFASWFLARALTLVMIRKPAIKRLVSFADPTFGHDGTLYRAAGWQYDGQAPASYWYWHRTKNEIYHKKTVWAAAKKEGVTEAELARKRHLLRVDGQPKLRFILNL